MRRLLILALFAACGGDSTGPPALTMTGEWSCVDELFSGGDLWTASLVEQRGAVTGTANLYFVGPVSCTVAGERHGTAFSADLACDEGTLFWGAELKGDRLEGSIAGPSGGGAFANMVRAGEPSPCWPE